MGEKEKQIDWLTPKEETRANLDDSMTLAKFSRIVKSGTTPPMTRSSKVSADQDNSSASSKRTASVMDSEQVKSFSIKRAEEFQANLDPALPSFVKSMVASHVASGYWLGLPAQFCHLYLPKEGPTITLVDEEGAEYPTRFIVEKTGLSAGWRKFSLDHKLVEGDALVFQLIEPTKLKVYIIRAENIPEAGVVLGLLDLEDAVKQSDLGNQGRPSKRPTRKCRRSLPLCILQGNNWSNSPPEPASNLVMPIAQTGNNSEEVNSEVLQNIELPGPIVEFDAMESLESFSIKVNGLIVDSDISEDVRTKYYELCRSQKAYLHEHLLKGFNSKLIAGIISETVNVADAITSSNLNTPQDDFTTWDKSLLAFEQLGMNVGFLRSRLQRLENLAFKSEQAMESKRYKEALLEQDDVAVEIRTVEARLAELKEEAERMEAEVKTLKVKVENHELRFLAEANAPW